MTTNQLEAALEEINDRCACCPGGDCDRCPVGMAIAAVVAQAEGETRPPRWRGGCPVWTAEDE